MQGSWTSIRNKGRDGHQWWVLTATDPDAPAPADLKAAAAELAAGFPAPLPGLIAATEPENVQRWVLRDRKPLKQWSKGRITLCGDAAHATSPYAAYGAGMSIEDGYFFGVALRGVDLTDLAAVRRALQSYEDPRKPHTAKQVQMAGCSARSSTTPRRRCGRSATSSSTTRRSCRRWPATPTRARSTSSWR